MIAESTLIALGSNLGDKEKNLRNAVAQLQKLSTTQLITSSIWLTSPEGFDRDVANFFNAVVFASVEMQAEELLVRLKEIERELGRAFDPGRAYLSRTIDLDIIDFGQRVIGTKKLATPHPRAAFRRFVLMPLQEIAPDFRFPGIEDSLEALIDKAPKNLMRRVSPLIPLE
jgi:2-amino-4-hydroxy-6-hydroxymethyldihydropteridine diphosphokinase